MSPAAPQDLPALTDWLKCKEDVFSLDIKPGNAARLIFRDRAKPEKCQHAVVYFHGFSSSPGESGSAPEALASCIQANLYVPRWPGHGLRSEEAMKGLTATDFIAAAEEALRVGLALGRRVTLVGTSMGGTLALYLAARHPESVSRVVLWSPAIRPFDPHGLEEACTQRGVLYRQPGDSDFVKCYWSQAIHTDGYRALRDVFLMVSHQAIFQRVRCPVFMGYYYRDKVHQDRTASVPAMLCMALGLGTSTHRIIVRAYRSGAHALGCPERSPDALRVLADSQAFLTATL